MRFNKFSTDTYFHSGENLVVLLTEDSPQLYPQPYSTLNQREFWKITSVLKGKGFMIINGRRYPVSPGFVCLIHPQDLTTWELTEPLTLYNVLFRHSVVSAKIAQWAEQNDFFAIFQTAEHADTSIRHELLHLLDANRNITALIKKMHNEFRRDDLHSADLLKFYPILPIFIVFFDGKPAIPPHFSVKYNKNNLFSIVKTVFLLDIPEIAVYIVPCCFFTNFETRRKK